MIKKHCLALIVTALALSPALTVLAAPPGRPADFKPFQYECSSEQLMEKFSARAFGSKLTAKAYQ